MSFSPFDTFGLLGDLTKPPTVTPTYTPGPTYQAGQNATNELGSQLTTDQNDPTGNFGAISPDWNDIWDQTQKQVQQYFNGTATSPGVNDQIKSSFAQRGMGGQPAQGFLEAQTGADESQQLGSLSAQQNIAKQQFAQQGKQNWMSNALRFQNQSANGPAGGDWNTTVTPNSLQSIVGAVAPIAAAGVGASVQNNANQNNNAYLSSILGQSQNPSGYAGSIADALPDFSALALAG